MSIPVYSIVGYSGTGKTTFLVNLIPELKKMGLRVAAIKHDAHEFDVDHEGKDTWRLTKAGADITCITSATHAAVMENRPTTIESILRGLRDVDVVVAEGYKQENYKKIGLYRAASRRPLAEIQGEFLAVCTDTPLDLDVPQFGLEAYAEVAEFIREDMGKLPVQNDLFGSVQLKLGRKGPESEIAFGKGLVDLLEGIDRSGSINHATKEMGMAYSKAWKIINNAEAKSGLTLVEREGPGGSKLTREGLALVRLYRQLSAEAQSAIDDLLAGGYRE